jgi:protein-disulfide isomerase/type II secretory pathway component PulC
MPRNAFSPGRRVAATLAAALLCGTLQGCGRRDVPEDESRVTGPAQAQSPETVVATIGGRSLTAAEADALIAGQLHEIDYQRYLLRRQAIEAELLRELSAPNAAVHTARIRIVPPMPPETSLSGAPAAARPDAKASVTVSVFCDFESPHCASIQAPLADLMRLYPGSVRMAARDLPLPMHRHAQDAAEAARCAGLQGRYWQFHDLLRARGLPPDGAEVGQVARAVGLDTAAFQRCIDGHAQAAAVAADAVLAGRLGLGAVPAVFVNGRMAVPPVTPDHLMWLVEEELQRAGAARGNVPASGSTRLPLTLRATIVGAVPGLGLALIGGTPGDSPVVRREGERVAPDAILRRVLDDRVELLVGDSIETLKLTSGSRPDTQDAGTQSQAAALPRSSPMPVFLDREMVRERMADRIALSARLKPVSMTVDGYRLLQLSDVPPGSLYELLGLQAGDVIVAVNEQPIHEGDNPLWDALDRENEVRVRVMRRGGIAHHYTYRFE